MASRRSGRTARTFAGLPVAERIADSRFRTPDGRRFVAAGSGATTRAFLEVVPRQHLARYPGELLLDTFLETVDGDLMRVQPEHLDHVTGFDATDGDPRLHRLPGGSWWLVEELARGTWGSDVLPQVWARAERLRAAAPQQVEAELLAVVAEVASTLDFAGPAAEGPAGPTHCARHGESHARREVDLHELCPLCARPVEKGEVVRWLVPPRRDAPGLHDLRMQWSRFAVPDWLT